MTEKVFVVEINPVVSIDGSTQQFLFGTRAFATGPADTPANTPVRPYLKNPGSLRRELFSGARVTGAITPSYGNIVLANMAPAEDAAGELDDWIGYGLSGSKIIVRYGEIGTAYPSAWTTVYIAYAQSFVADLNEITIRLRDRLQLFDQPIVVDGFSGAGGLEGTVSAAKKKQFVAGFCPFVPAVLIDEAKQIYFAQSTAPYTYDLTDNFFVYDNGVGINKQANYQTSDDLLNVAPEAGYCRFYFGNESVYTTYDLVYDPATRTFRVAPDVPGAIRRYPHRNGPVYFRLGSPPAGDIRILTYGAPNDLDYLKGGANVAVGQFTAATFALRVGVELTDVDASASTLVVTGRYVSDNSTYLDVMADQCLASQGWFGFTRLDKLRAGLLKDPTEEPSTSQYEFTLANIQGLRREPVNGMEAPVWKVSVRAGKTYPSQVANGANAAIKDYLTRDVWNSFQGVSTTTLLQNPGAIASSFEIQGRDFLLQEQIESFLRRYFLLYGGRRDFFTFTTPMTEETLALELHDVVTLKTPRFGLSAGKKFRIVGIEIQCGATKGPAIKFTLWGGEMGILTGYDGGPGSKDYSAPSIIDPLILQEYLGNFEGLFIADVKLPSDTLSLIGNFDGPFIGIIGGTAADCDNDFDKVVLLLHCDGANMATTFTDSSSYARSMTAAGNAQLSTAQARFGTAAGYFDGNGDYVSAPASADFDLGTVSSSTNFTVELWARLDEITSGFKTLVIHALPGSSGNGKGGWAIRETNGKLQFVCSKTTASNPWFVIYETNTSILAANIWYHIALVIENGVPNIYVDGTKIASTFLTTDASYATSIIGFDTSRTNYGVRVGAIYTDDQVVTPTNYFKGYIDDLRITKGLARYTTDFTPPNAAFANVACASTDAYFDKVVLLMHMDGADNSTTFFDESLYDTSMVAYGNASIKVAQSKFGGASGYFDGNGDYVANTNLGPNFSIFSNNFTIEAWVYYLSKSGNKCVIEIGSASTNRANISLVEDQFVFYTNVSGLGDGIRISASSPAINTWHHIALVKSSNTFTLFINGVNSGTSTTNVYPTSSSLSVYIGSNVGAGSSFWNGYIDEVRITKDISRYTADFTPPSTAFADQFPDTSVSLRLLLHFNGTNGSTTFVDSSSFANAATVFGNTQISTAQSKFGGASGKFDGSGDYLEFANNFPFQNNDYTIECWVYINNVNHSFTIFSDGAINSAVSNSLVVYGTMDNGDGIFKGRVYDHLGNPSEVTKAYPLTPNTWHHVAVTSQAKTVRFFVGGVVMGSFTSPVNIKNPSTTLKIGTSWFGSLNGYIDEFRVTIGEALYTAAFTPPTAPFPDA